MKMNIPGVIKDDLAAYKKAGVNKITMLSFLRYSWWAYAFNMFVYARIAWTVNYDHVKGLDEFCVKLYPQSYKTMGEYYFLLEKSSIGILSFCEYKEYLSDLRDIPPQSPAFYYKHIEQIKESIDILKKCAQLLQVVIETNIGREKELLADEMQILNITLKEAEALYFQMLGRYMYYVDRNSDIGIFKTYMDKAINCKIDIKRFIETVSDDLKGCCGTDPFVKHLCDDQIDFLKRLKEEHGLKV